MCMLVPVLQLVPVHICFHQCFLDVLQHSKLVMYVIECLLECACWCLSFSLSVSTSAFTSAFSMSYNTENSRSRFHTDCGCCNVIHQQVESSSHHVRHTFRLLPSSSSSVCGRNSSPTSLERWFSSAVSKKPMAGLFSKATSLL